MNKFSKLTILVSLIILLVAGVFVWNKNKVLAPADNFAEKAAKDLKVGETTEQSGNSSEGTNGMENNSVPADSSALPAKIFIKVPFTSQAPFANWDAYHEEACEEAALIMVRYYLDKKSLTPAIAEAEIQNLIKFQLEKYGDYKDSDAAEMVRLAREYYKIGNLKVIYDFGKEDIKKELAKGKPIIIPAAGRLLGNPNFKQPGPLYHALVLTGYNGNTVITNDPGTRKGERYEYSLDVLYNAIHDFPGNLDNIQQGRKAMIVLE